MLVLSRKNGEKIIIGNNVAVTVVSIDGNRVKLGITAPPEISVHRQEIFIELHAGENGDRCRELVECR